MIKLKVHLNPADSATVRESTLKFALIKFPPSLGEFKYYRHSQLRSASESLLLV